MAGATKLPDLGVKHALLLQGPMGPFFSRFADDLVSGGIAVTKINLNAGDAFYYRRPGALAYRGRLDGFADYVRRLCRDRGIDGIFVFGDGRPYHRRAIEAARELGLKIWVFEEGYLRPDYITLEREGVNGNSTMPRDPQFFRAEAAKHGPSEFKPEAVGQTFGRGAWYSTVYSLAMTVLFFLYPFYEHHRPLNAFAEAFRWVRGGYRKLVYKARDRGVVEELVKRADKRFFVVALQVHCDNQLKHSRFGSIESFIVELVESFAREAPADALLVIKHHPMDRAYRDYSRMLRELRAKHGLGERLVYVHDVNLPQLLKHACGTVCINSTVGLSSVFYGTPVKVLGAAVYDMAGLTCQAPLEQFWRDPGVIDTRLSRAFREWLLRHNQANGSFMKRLSSVPTGAGVRWFPLG